MAEIVFPKWTKKYPVIQVAAAKYPDFCKLLFEPGAYYRRTALCKKAEGLVGKVTPGTGGK